MIKVHHNTAKKAKAHKIDLASVEGEIVASKDGAVLARGMMGNKVLDEAIAKLGAPIVAARAKAKKAPKAKKPAKVKRSRQNEDDLEEEGDEDAPEGRSIIKSKYKKVYKPFKMTNGDDLNLLLAKHLKQEDESGQLRINVRKLVQFAKANDCWVDGYKDLNVGQQRLNVGNRLRAKIKRGWEVKWG